jgi:hypothetical protein
MLPFVLGAIRVPRPGVGRARTRPDRVLADKAYSSRAIRAHLRTRGIGSVIPEPDDQKAHRKRIGSFGGRPVTYDRTAYRGRNVIEIVCTQVTKPRVGAALGGWDHIPDLYVAIGHHDPVDQQLHQLAALLEAGLVKAHPELLQYLGHRLGGRAQPDQPLPLGRHLPLARQQVRLLLAKGPVLALEAGQVDHLGQVGLQQALALTCNAGQHPAEGRLPAAELLGHPGATVSALHRLGDQLRMLQDRAQVRPHQLVELVWRG